jgi:hypothetical protein
MDGQKLDQLRHFVAWEIAQGERHIAEWALAQIEELIAEKTELQIELAACAAILIGPCIMGAPGGPGPSISEALRKTIDDLRGTAPVTLQRHMADALAKLKPN